MRMARNDVTDVPRKVYGNLSKRKNIRKVTINFYIFALGCLLLQGTIMSVSSLQSSINIKKNIGTKTLGTSKLTSTLAGLFCTPLIIRKIGYKWSLVLGETAAILFVAGNFYPAPYIMIPVGILEGIGSSLVWTTMPIYNIVFGQMHGLYGSKESDDYERKYTGQFFAILRSGRIFTSILSYAILYSTRSDIENTTTNSTVGLFNGTTMMNNYEHCGANDCQNPNVTKKFLNNYVPPNAISVYSLMGAFILVALCAIGLHAKFLVNSEVKNVTKPTEIDESEDVSVDKTTKKIDVSLLATLKATMKHTISLKQILLFPMLLHYGLFLAFVYSEMNRAFSSCILGVEMVGPVLVLYDVFHIGASLLIGKIIGFFGKNATVATIATLTLANYLLCEFWKPTTSTTFLVYFLSVGFGVTDALWKNSTVAIVAQYFPENREISFSVRNVCITIGITIGYFWSPFLCVGSKIYIHIALLVISVLAYGVAEFHLYRKNDTPTIGRQK
ncbi:protein unc-93 homolog A-like [Styela clava]